MEQERKMNIIRKFFIDVRYYLFKMVYPSPKIHSRIETLEHILVSGKSVARFGDGEFHMISHQENLGFQDMNDQLSKRLYNILISQKKYCLVCLPEGLQSIKRLTGEGHFFWKQFWVFHYRKYIKLFDFKRTYYNANLTRPYMDYKDKSSCGIYFERIKDLWINKNILIVEGEMSRLGIGNDLFNGAKSIHRVITLPKNAFSIYDKLYDGIKSIARQYDLVLIALGPTATVLAYDIGLLGVQAIDIGHIDIEYEWFLKDAKKKIPVAGKHVNELSYSINEQSNCDIIYNGQIIKHIFN